MAHKEPPPTPQEVREAWHILSLEERVEALHLMDPADAHEFFLSLSSGEQASILRRLPEGERKIWFRSLAPDDAADILQTLPEEERGPFLQLLDEHTRQEVSALLAYAEDAAGGLMSPRFARLRPEMTVGEAIRYLRHQAKEKLETIYYAYVLDHDQKLKGVVSFRDLFAARDEKLVSEVMNTDVVFVHENTGQEEVARLMARYDLTAIPVVDAEKRMKGIITIDDIVDVVEEAATEDIQKLGGMEVVDVPYMQAHLSLMIRKRAGWLAALFLSEMLTASAMGSYEDEIARAVVLALFVPLIISSGGNSGSQATTLIIRAMALGEVTLRDWWRVAAKELVIGLALGVFLAGIGMARVVLWQWLFDAYGPHYLRVALTVALSLIGVVTWGTFSGSMLPFVIRRLGFDPASASAPFVATLVDVSGIVIYFSVAQLILRGTLL
ncbi:MAG: magnesium transporter [Deltaproteobacteria bacterium]|nr:magnesium transporter [Deltaproteobacteria bacterium]